MNDIDVDYEEIESSVRRYISAHLPNSTIFLSGSVASGTYTPVSDVDVYALNAKIRLPHRLQTVHESRFLQINIMSLAAALNIIQDASLRGDPFYVEAFSSSRFLDGSWSQYEILLEDSIGVLRRGPARYAPSSIEFARISFINIFRRVSNRILNDPFVSDLYCSRFVRYVQMKQNSWLYTGRWVHRSPAFQGRRYDLLLEMIAAARSHDWEGVEKITAEFLTSEELCWSTQGDAPIPFRP